MRRLIFAFNIENVQETIVYQVFIADTLSTLLLAYYITIRPMVDGINNFIQIFNEFVVLCAIEMMFLFTLYVGEPEIRYQFGFYFIYLLGFNLAVNLIVLIYNLSKSIYLAIRA